MTISRSEAGRALRAQRTTTPRTCAVCGQEFAATERWARYCSAKCKYQARQARQKRGEVVPGGVYSPREDRVKSRDDIY